MSIYTLMHRNTPILLFKLGRSEVIDCALYENNLIYLPIPLKRILHNKEEFVSKSSDGMLFLNEDGCFLLDNWLSDREIPSNRDNYKKYVPDKKTSLMWMLENYGYSYTDNYWINNLSAVKNYAQILEIKNNIDEHYSIVIDNKHFYRGANSTLGGQLEKYWYKSDGVLKLCKRVEKNFDILNCREIIASLIYQKQGFKNYCNYEFVKDKQGDVIGCKCKAFTNDHMELLTAYDLLEEYNLTQQPNVYELIPDLAAKYDADKYEIEEQLDLETLVDYLILNRDRHQENIGFLRDNNTLQIIKAAPIFDSGSCKFLEAAYPESVENTTINGLYSTESELLSHVKNFSVLDIEKLPSTQELKQIYDQCNFISEQRKQKLLNLFEAKKEHIYKLQQEQQYNIDPFQEKD